MSKANPKTGMAETLATLPQLAQQFGYPYLQLGEGGFNEGLTAAYQPLGPQAEAIRSLRSQLLLRWFNAGHRQLALVGVGSGEGCSFIAANLAVAFSQLGQRTVLVDANLRNPRQHQLFGLGGRQGLSGLLAGSVGMEAVSKIPSFADLSVLPAGTLPPNPQELLGRPAFKLLLRDLAENYDITLLDTPNGLLYADTQNIAAETGAALLVMQRHHARMSDALALQAQLANAKAQILGAVLNGF
ncbi:MAG: polysaccharide biosynthesis tyrosine autokinase [Proteobacteria bacterium]|nr:polysaccharide biosynthesis tyrosine autokinase [Pseudomonadota bacterium]